METLELSYRSWGDSLMDAVRLEFKTTKKLRLFINSGAKENVFRINNRSGFFKIVTINKVMHTSIDAKIECLSLREYNLDKLGI